MTPINFQIKNIENKKNRHLCTSIDKINSLAKSRPES